MLDDAFALIEAESVTGAFEGADGFIIGGALRWSLSYLSDSVWLTVIEILLGDANKDGVVSAGDYASIQQNFGATGFADGSLIGDANGDGLVSAGDYASVQQNFGATVNGSMNAALAPEPTSLALVGLGMMALARRRSDVSRA